MDPATREAELRALREASAEDFAYVSGLVSRMNERGVRASPVDLPEEWDENRKERVFHTMANIGFTPMTSRRHKFRAPQKQALLSPLQATLFMISKGEDGQQDSENGARNNASSSQQARTPERSSRKAMTPDGASPESPDLAALVSGLNLDDSPTTPLAATAKTPRSVAARSVASSGRSNGSEFMSPAQRRVTQIIADVTPSRRPAKAHAVMIGQGLVAEHNAGKSTLDVDFDMDNGFVLVEFDEGAERRRVVLPFECIKRVEKSFGTEMQILFESIDDVLVYTFNASWQSWVMGDSQDPFFERVAQAVSLCRSEPSIKIQFCKVESMENRLAKLNGAVEALRTQRATPNDAQNQVFESADGSTNDFYRTYRLMPPALGTGAFAEVFVAQKASTKEKFAVKVMNTKKINKKTLGNVLLEFERAKTASDHPNVATMYEMYADDGKLMLVQELCSGGELFDRIIDTEGVPEADCKVIMRQLLSAVQYLHDQGTIHRDLKPENIMFKKSGGLEIRLIDFGIGRTLSEKSESNATGKQAAKKRLQNRISMQTMHSPSHDKFCARRHITLEAAQTICGTHEYSESSSSGSSFGVLLFFSFFSSSDFLNFLNFPKLFVCTPTVAPEVWQASADEGYGTSCDVWSCGVIMFAMMSMSPAFFGETPAQIREAVLHGEPDFDIWPFAGDSDTDDGLVGPLCEPFVRRLLEHDSRKRPSAGGALGDPWFQFSH
jgi:serine/threonine protein kinase